MKKYQKLLELDWSASDVAIVDKSERKRKTFKGEEKSYTVLSLCPASIYKGLGKEDDFSLKKQTIRVMCFLDEINEKISEGMHVDKLGGFVSFSWGNTFFNLTYVSGEEYFLSPLEDLRGKVS